MATDVRFSIPEQKIGQNGVTFSRSKDGLLHGDLTIRQNTIEWRPKRNQLVYKISWKKFADLIEAETKSRIRPKATKVRATKKLKS